MRVPAIRVAALPLVPFSAHAFFIVFIGLFSTFKAVNISKLVICDQLVIKTHGSESRGQVK